MNLERIFHDESYDFLSNFEPKKNEIIKIKIRVEKNYIGKIYLLVGNNKYIMNKYKSDEHFDYYVYKYKIVEDILYYSFKLESPIYEIYYSKIGVSFEKDSKYDFKLISDFKTPDWAKGAIMYQIYIDRFRRSNLANPPFDNEYIYIGRPVKYISDWESLPEEFDVHRFYGGDLLGVLEKLNYLKSLGVEVIYFNPLFVSPSNHKYDTQDYEYIDPHLVPLKSDIYKNSLEFSHIERTAKLENLENANAFFAKFMEKAHNLGIKVILDGVFNHCGSIHKWMDKENIYKKANELFKENYPLGAYEGKNSPYRKYFEFYSDNSYESWWGHDTLPKLNYENNKNLLVDILNIAKKWLEKPYNIDGWRIDVAADIGHTKEFNHFFFREFRNVVKNTNKDALILAEHYGNPSDWLDGSQWDSVMNYDAFMEPVTWFLTGLEKHSDKEEKSLCGNGQAFFSMIKQAMSYFTFSSLLVAMNELSNHDHSRFLTRTNKKVGRLSSLGFKAASEGINYAIFRQAINMQMTLPGAPTIYYGDEAGVVGFTDPDNRRTYPWGKENYELIMYYRYLAIIHKENIALKLGSFIPLIAKKNIVAYARTYKNNKIIVLIYTGDEENEIDVPIYLAGINKNSRLQRLIYTDEFSYNPGYKYLDCYDKQIKIVMKANSSIILKAIS